MIFLIIFGVLLGIVTGLLVLPLKLRINSRSEEYYFSYSSLIKIWLDPEENYRPKLRFFFWNYRLNRPAGKKSTKRGHTGKKRSKYSVKNIPYLVKGFMQCITLKKFCLSFDTGNYPLNAILVPVIQTINNEKIIVQVNFNDQFSIDFMAITRLYHLILFYIKILITNKSKKHGN